MFLINYKHFLGRKSRRNLKKVKDSTPKPPRKKGTIHNKCPQRTYKLYIRPLCKANINKFMEDGKIMNDNEIKKIQENIEASMAVEGIKPSDTAKEINKKFLAGEITSSEAIKRIKEYHLNCLVLPVTLVKINPHFGEDLYSSLKSPLFYIAFIIVIVALVRTLCEEKFKIAKTIGQVLISALILFIIYNPLLMVNLGSFIFNFIFGLAKDMEVKEGVKVIISAL